VTTAQVGQAIFGTFSSDAEPIEEYLGADFVRLLATIFRKQVRVLGYQRQYIRGNWKLYADNVRDPNHGGLLHPFTVNMASYRLTMSGGALLDAEGRHNATYTLRNTDAADARSSYSQEAATTLNDNIRVRDPRLFVRHVEHEDGISTAIVSIFPGVVFQRIGNSYAVRHIRPATVGAFDLHWTYFGYEDDDAEMVRHRIRQANLSGASGLISLEDGEAIEFVFRTISSDRSGASMPIIGGLGPVESQQTMVTEVPVRGFWRHWKSLMSARS
jgi:anthranilate 1,2-dioxygenase large subunit